MFCDGVRNIFTDSVLYAEAATNPVITLLNGAGTTSPGYAANGAGITDDTYDPSQEVSYPQTIVFNITYTPDTPAGYNLSGCGNCIPDSLTVTYNVTESFALGNPSNIATCNNGDA